MCGASFGACAITVESTLPTCQPAALIRRAASASRASESAPRYCASVSGKWWPMSPSAAAPKRASVIAWQRRRRRSGRPGRACARSRRRRARACGRRPGRACPSPRRCARSGRVASCDLPLPAPRSIASASARSSGWVTFRFSRAPGTSRGFRPMRLDRARLVGRRSRPRASASASRPRRNICGVCACQRPSRGCVAATRPRVCALERVGDRHREQPADRIVARRRRSGGRSTRRGPGSAPRRGRGPSRRRVAPSLISSARPAATVAARARRRSGPPRSLAAGRPDAALERLVVGRERRPGPPDARTRGSAASVCATSGRRRARRIAWRPGAGAGRCRRRARGRSSGGRRSRVGIVVRIARRARKDKPRGRPP